jgi:hypothetical protein
MNTYCINNGHKKRTLILESAFKASQGIKKVWHDVCTISDMNETNKNMKNETLRAGQRFYYVGDCANISTWGTITKVRENTGYGLSYEVMYDDSRFEGDTLTGCVEHFSFICGGVGQRFFTLEDWKEVERKAVENYIARYGNL